MSTFFGCCLFLFAHFFSLSSDIQNIGVLKKFCDSNRRKKNSLRLLVWPMLFESIRDNIFFAHCLFVLLINCFSKILGCAFIFPSDRSHLGFIRCTFWCVCVFLCLSKYSLITEYSGGNFYLIVKCILDKCSS